MGQDPALGLVVLVFAMFGLPRLMSVMPDFDPLMMIVAAFAILALLQHLGIVTAPEGGAGGPGGPDGRGADGPRRSGGVGRPSNGGRDAPAAGQEGSGRGKRDAEGTVKDLLKEAEQCFEQNSWKAVQEITGKIVNRDPENARAWELLALAQKWDGKREEAAATVKKARELYEVESKGLSVLAKEFAGAHDSSAASAENEKRGEDFLARRQYDLAMECFNKAIDELGDAPTESDSSRSLKLRRYRCDCAQQLHDFSQCRRDATFILEKEPNDTKALLQRAISNEGLEKFSAALEDARKLLMLDPKSVAANRIINNCRKAM